MNLSYLFYEDDDDRLLYEIYRRSTALATEHATRDRPHYNCVRAINRYARKLIEWASSGYEGQEPLPSKGVSG